MIKILKYKSFLEKKIYSEMPIPNDILNISKEYIKAGKDIFLVGGCIRDFLQDKTPKDYDLVTNALPNESKEILKNFNVSDEQGKNFGVLRVYTKDEPKGYEVASYRKDISVGRDTKGDDQKVEMGNHITIYDDCMRRDLSINSLFYNIKTKEIVDIVGGVDDIKNGVIRAVGDPLERFKEDRLRILRVLRFSARTGGIIDIDTKKAILSDNRLRNINPKEDVSQERIWEEFEKAFEQSIDFNTYLKYLDEYNMWNEMFPNSTINKNFIKSKNLIIIIASLFKNMEFSTLERKMVRNWKIQTVLATKVVFLLMLKTLTPETAFNLYKLKLRYFVDDELIIEWLKVNKIKNKLYDVFLEYKPSVTSDYLVSKGFTLNTKALGDEQKRLEIEEFKKLCQNQYNKILNKD